MKFSCVSLFFVVVCYASNTISASADLITSIGSYSTQAKEFSRKSIPPEEARKLFSTAKSILETINQKYFTKLGVRGIQDLFLIYRNGKKFPDVSEHNVQNEYDKQIITFTIAIYLVYVNLTDEILLKIIEKSPLELVPLFREIDVFLQFISADPRDFGHGVFTERSSDHLVIFPTDDAILRIMRVIILKNLLSSLSVYKLSRITSAFVRYFSIKKPDVIIMEVVETLKRSLIDDSRVALFTQHGIVGS
ncbi:MAG: hypothetical protein LBL32_00535 [Holosporales bacterium]|jgi:hypothetical protein|nr:hypothetical protein [Holosporales bacterium]